MSLYDGYPINLVNQYIKHLNVIYEQTIELYCNKSKQSKEIIIELLNKES